MNRLLNVLGWPLAAVLSAMAVHVCRGAVGVATPVDRSLWFVALVIAVVAWLRRPVLLAAVPLLMAVMLALPDERLRLLAYGVVVALTFFIASVERRRRGARGRPPEAPRASPYADVPAGEFGGVPLAVLAVIVLRWIPLENVLWFRELALLAIVAAIVFVLRATPLAVAAGVLVGLFTPAIPMRTLGYALLALIAAMAVRWFGVRRRAELRVLPATLLALPLVFFAWSGIVARGLPLVFHKYEARPRHLMHTALAPSRSMELWMPEHARALIVSGANVPRLKPGTPLGVIQPDGIVIRIGDAADWGFMRREHWYKALNELPRDPAGVVRDYGYAAWVDGAGRIPLRGGRMITVTADDDLPADASLQVEALELQ